MLEWSFSMRHPRFIAVVFATILLKSGILFAESGYDLWLRYVKIADANVLSNYKSAASQIVIQGSSATMTAAGDELSNGLKGLLGQAVQKQTSVSEDGAIVVGTPSNSSIISDLKLTLDKNPEAYSIVTTKSGDHSIIAVASVGDIGALYGTFHLLRIMQTGESLSDLNIQEKPAIKRRMLNHWDNIDGTIERGYAGKSLWNWSALPGTLDKRYTDYARACASIGINGTVVNNVNANTGNNFNMLTTDYLKKVKALADVFRPYGVKVYMCASFGSPKRIGGLSTNDPLDASVISWWKTKADEIYKLMPDFGGFLIKANSEGQDGPKNYGRTHAEGANCLADAMAPHGGVVIWRAFVYDDVVDSDRMKRAYKEFKALDGKFRSNVIIQSKNGPFDFQPREPVAPLFGGLTSTQIGAELQITKEYLGQNVHLVYLAPMWKEFFNFDTYAKGAGSTVGKVLDGTVYNDTMSCIAGVANTGSDENWCGHHFDQANWYAFGRFAWNYSLSSSKIAYEWTMMTWGWNETVVKTIAKMLKSSREACVDYMDPLGLGGIFAEGHHYGPDPAYNVNPDHLDWNSTYWHKADATGVGYNRTTSGSDYVSQYFPENKTKFNSMATCPVELLCWFHHVPWGEKLSTGKTFWNELCFRYAHGLEYVKKMRDDQWPSLSTYIDSKRFGDVTSKLATHYTDAKTWYDVCTKYWGSFSKLTVPAYTAPASASDYYNTYDPNDKFDADNPDFPPPPGGTAIRTIKKQSIAFEKSKEPLFIFNLQGKLIQKIDPQLLVSRTISIDKVAHKTSQGIVVIKQNGVKPMTYMSGVR
jgi:alpha-glucuronidase